MEVSKLKKGMIFKNYRVLCEFLNIPIKDGSSKKSQIKELSSYCKYHQDKNSYTIDKIYNIPLKKINKRKEFKGYKIDEGFDDSIGIYGIIKGDDVYIGSTISGFRRRFLQHNHIHTRYGIQTTKNMIDNEGYMIIIHNLDGLEDEPLIRMIENEYINYFRNYTNFNVVNVNETWSYKESKKIKTKNIKIKESDYNYVVDLLRSYNVDIFNEVIK